MPIDNEQQTNFIVRAALYVLGVLLGLAARLSVLNNRKPLKWQDILMHGSIAFACAWAVWAVLAHYGKIDLANIASVFAGRYGDDILILTWKGIKNGISNILNNEKGN